MNGLKLVVDFYTKKILFPSRVTLNTHHLAGASQELSYVYFQIYVSLALEICYISSFHFHNGSVFRE